MRKITKRMAREIYTRGFCLTKKYEYYENMEMAVFIACQ